MKIADLMMMRGRTAVITGAAGHLGRVIAETLAELGSHVVLVDRSETVLDEVKQDLESRWSIPCDIFACDLEDDKHRTRLVEWVRDELRTLNVLVNNAAFVGTSELTGWSGLLQEQTVETWRRAMEVNLTAAFDLSKNLVTTLKADKNSSILNIASIYGSLGPDWSLYKDTELNNPAAYAVSKGGLIQLTRWLATTLAPEIRVNCISPGGIYRNQPNVFVDRYVSRTPIGRMATEDDFRGAVAFFASDLSAYVTGQNLCVDGGWSVW